MGLSLISTMRSIAERYKVLKTPEKDLPLLIDTLELEEAKEEFNNRLRGKASSPSQLLDELLEAITLYDEEQNTEEAKRYRQYACEHYDQDGLDIDEDAYVATGDIGANVMSWVWVYKEDTE